jgi:hypothetical protein
MSSARCSLRSDDVPGPRRQEAFRLPASPRQPRLFHGEFMLSNYNRINSSYLLTKANSVAN